MKTNKMEIQRGLRGLRLLAPGLNPGLVRLRFIGLMAGLLLVGPLSSQNLPKDVCRIVDGKLVFQIDPAWSAAQIGLLVEQFHVDSTLVVEAFKGVTSMVVDGVRWDIRKTINGLIELTREGDAIDQIGEVLSPIVLLQDFWLGQSESFRYDGPVYGVNTFKRSGIFRYENGQVSLTLPGFRYARKVLISGTFNDWSTERDSMTRTEEGWEISLTLPPGSYPYKFIVDGRWMMDPNNENREDDLNGGNNSVFYCYNHVFHLQGYTDARQVNLAGSFNGFNPTELSMNKSESGWSLPIYLGEGTYSYKFIVDGRWMTDPANPVIRGDGRGNRNSFMSIGDTLVFRVKGFLDASQVELAGSFNNWQWGELLMERTADGWELPYVLPTGNHEYKFIVDGKWTIDPGNPFTTGQGNRMNSWFAYRANYQFEVEEFPDAKQVIVTGTFNNWRTDGYRMVKIGGKWVFPIWLKPGKYSYRLIVDGKWTEDPGNPLFEPNEYGQPNSVVWVK